jgi:fructose-1,6-bisphosphatase/inositol monophosphatase family enzyme
VDHKAYGSELTETDRGAEQSLQHLVAERYLDHTILGEEFGGNWMCGVHLLRKRSLCTIWRTISRSPYWLTFAASTICSI